MKNGWMGRVKKDEVKGGKGGTSSTAYPRCCHPICLLPPATTSTTGNACDRSGGIRVLHPDNANGTWCGFTPS